LSIYSLGNTRTVSTNIGDFTCEIGEFGLEYPYRNFENSSGNYSSDASIFGEITI